MPGPFRPGHRPSAKQLNAQAEQARRLANLRAGPGQGYSLTPSGLQLRNLTPQPFWVRLDDYDPDSGIYAFTEMRDVTDDDGVLSFVELTDGRVGTFAPDVDKPLYEVNGGELPTEADGEGDGPIVQAWPAPGGDWFLFAGGGGAGTTARIRPTGKPFVQDDGDGDVRYYPAVRDLDDSDGPGFHDGVAVWLVQRDGFPLGTTGNSNYLSLRKLGTFTVTTCDGDEDRELWCTTEKIEVVRVDFDTCTAYYSDAFEGDQLCDFLTIDGDLVTIDGSYIGV